MASAVTAFDYDTAKGTLRPIQTISTLPSGSSVASSCAEIQLHPSGRFLYGSNRGHDSLAIFAVSPDTGRLTAVDHVSTGGKNPRSFSLDPTGRWLLAANQDSNSIVVFRVDPATGRLTPAGTVISVPKPVCVLFLTPRP